MDILDGFGKILKDATQALYHYRSTQPAGVAVLQQTVERVQILARHTSSQSAVLQLSCSSLPTLDCISALVTVLTDLASPNDLTLPCMGVLENLASSQETRCVLQGTLQIPAVLTALLQRSHSEKLQYGCLKALQAVTYDAVFTASDGFVEQLVHAILPHILSPVSDFSVPSLAILANITRKSVFAQTYVKSLPNARTLLRTLISCLSHANVSVIVCSLAPLTNLCLHEELGAKLFNSKNVHQSFQLIFGLLSDDTGPVVMQYAVDLFCDLLSSSSIAQALVEYPSLKESLVLVTNHLQRGPAVVSCKLLELLCNLCAMPGLDDVRHCLCQLVLGSAAVGDASQQCPFLVLLQCTAQCDHQTSLFAWKLISHMFTATQEYDDVPSLVDHATVLLRAAAIPLTHLASGQLWSGLDGSDVLLRQRHLQVVLVLQLLNRIVSEQQFSSVIFQHITPELCSRLLEQQLSNNHIICDVGNGSATSRALRASQSTEWSMDGVNVVLLTLHLLSQLNKQSTQIEVQLQRVYQDSRLLPFLAAALKSEKGTFVESGLSLLLAACQRQDKGTLLRLADVIAKINSTLVLSSSSGRDSSNGHIASNGDPSRMQRSAAISHGAASTSGVHTALSSMSGRHCVASAVGTSTTVLSPPPTSQSQSADVHALIERMQSGLDLKDIRAHEIMEIYEHELATCTTKESHLQDLLEAKTMALAQADRLIVQYRCRCAQSELECSKLRALLQESEKRCSNQQLELDKLSAAQDELHEEISSLQVDRQQLGRLTQEHTQLRTAHEELKLRLDGTLRRLSAAQEEQASLSDLLELQCKHSDKLKAQFESSNRQVSVLEEQLQQTRQQLAVKEAQCNELQYSLQQCEKLLANQEQHCSQLQSNLQDVKADLSQVTEAKHLLVRQVATLEEDLTQTRKSLEGAENELEKHRKLRAMIHNLSGGINSQNAGQQ